METVDARELVRLIFPEVDVALKLATERLTGASVPMPVPAVRVSVPVDMLPAPVFSMAPAALRVIEPLAADRLPAVIEPVEVAVRLI